MDKEFSNLSSFGSAKPSSSPKKKAFIYVILFAVIIGAAIFAGNYFLSGKATKAVPTPTVTMTPTDTPIPTPTASLSATPTPSSKTTPTPTDKVSPTTSSSKTLQIEVLNGSGTPGLAGKVASFLRSNGYGITSTGNADTFDYTKTTIQIKKSKNQFSAQLRKDLSASYTVDPTIQTLAESATPDAIVIVGAE